MQKFKLVILNAMLKKICSLLILLMCICFANAQVRLVRENKGSNSAAIKVYEAGAVEIEPVFPGGESEMVNFINKTRCYPADAHEKGIQGRVTCKFTVCPDGSIKHIEILKSVCPAIDEEAIRIIRQMPRWNAGELKGRKVYVSCVVTIPFRI